MCKCVLVPVCMGKGACTRVFVGGGALMSIVL